MQATAIAAAHNAKLKAVDDQAKEEQAARQNALGVCSCSQADATDGLTGECVDEAARQLTLAHGAVVVSGDEEEANDGEGGYA